MFKATTNTLHGIMKRQQERLPTRLPSVKPNYHITKALDSIEYHFNRIKQKCTAQSQYLFIEHYNKNFSDEYFTMLNEHKKYATPHKKTFVTALDDARDEINRLKDLTNSNEENLSQPLTKSQITAFSTRCLRLRSTIVKYFDGINELIDELHWVPPSDEEEFTSEDDESDTSQQRLTI